MSELEDQLDRVEIDIDDARATINKMEQLKTLMDTSAWKDIVDEGYFVQEASRLVLLKSDPEMFQDRQQAEIQKGIDAIGPFRQYLRVIMQIGMMAERAMQSDQQTREELLEEEAHEGEVI